MTPFHNLPISQRPRERLLQYGSGSLEDLLAVLIRTGSKQHDVLSVSQRLASCLVGGQYSISQLSQIPGVGPTKAAVVVAALSLADSLAQRRAISTLSKPEEVYAACTDLLEETQEHLVAFYLTVRGGQIARQTITIGTATASLVHPREVFRPAIQHNASHLVLAHNHPSGDPTPSQADIESTLLLVRAGFQVGIEVVDHVICGREQFISLREQYGEVFEMGSG